MSKFVVSLFMAVAVALPMFPAAADKSGLNGKALREAIAGRTVRLATPIGALPIRYLRNGTMSGAGSTLLAQYMGSNKDTGRWWIAGNRLCQKWSKWMDGRSYC